MDEIDLANVHSEAFQALALAEQRRNREPDNNTGAECVDCYEEIPEERRRAKPGCWRCIDCQTIFEQRGM